jgi:heavy metal sensor kinase
MPSMATLPLRTRLTLWNAGVLAFTLVVIAAAAYFLLADASIDQLDDILAVQLQTMQRAASTEPSTPQDFGANLQRVVTDLDRRGFHTSVVHNDSTTMIVGAVRLDRAQSKVSSDEKSEDGLQQLRLAAPTQQRIAAHVGQHSAFDLTDSRAHLRARLTSGVIANRPVTFVVVAPLVEVRALLESLRGTFLIAIPIALAITVAIGYGLARRSLSPIMAMTAQAERISAQTLHERLPVMNPHDELGRLASTFNLALDRIDAALEQQRRFTADASHELRTPVAVIRTEADVALDGAGRSPRQYRDALVVIRDGSEQLSRIVNDLFLLARADAGQVTAVSAPVYLDDLVAETVRGVKSLAARRGVEIQLRSAEELLTWGDEALLRRVVINLLDNAIKYAPAGSVVTVRLSTTGNLHRLTVTDTGPGVPDAAKGLIFDRFYRADSVRTHDETSVGSGAGLGLSIAREIALLHHGAVALSGSRPGETTFELTLPDADSARPMAGAS